MAEPMIGRIVALKWGFIRAGWQGKPWKLPLSILGVLVVVVIGVFVAYLEHNLLLVASGAYDTQLFSAVMQNLATNPSALSAASSLSAGSLAQGGNQLALTTASLVPYYRELALAMAPLYQVVGSVLIVLWWLMTLTFFNIDETLNPQKFSIYGIGYPRLLVGLTAANCVSFPTIATFLLILICGWVFNPLLALVAAILGTLTCVVGARAITSLLSAVLSSRRAATAVGIIFAVLVVALIYAIEIAVQSGQTAALLIGAAGVMPVLQWTPLGAAFSVVGNPLLILPALAYLVVLLLVWAWRLRASIENFRTSNSVSSARGLGAYGRATANPASAIHARLLSGLHADSRVFKNLVMIPVVVALFVVMGILQPIKLTQIMYAYMVIWLVVYMLITILQFSFSYDGQGLTMHFIAGVPAQAECDGRARLLLYIILPLAVVASGVIALLFGDLKYLPGALGSTAGFVLLCTGLALYCNARMIVQVPDTTSPFARNAGRVGSPGRLPFILLILLVSFLPYASVGVVGFAQALGGLPIFYNWLLGALWLVLGIPGYLLLRRAAIAKIDSRNVQILVDLKQYAA
jgi:ABC-2 type transport system permease protein